MLQEISIEVKMTKEQDQVYIFVQISEFYPWATAMILIEFFQLSNRPVSHRFITVYVANPLS